MTYLIRKRSTVAIYVTVREFKRLHSKNLNITQRRCYMLVIAFVSIQKTINNRELRKIDALLLLSNIHFSCRITRNGL